MPSQTQLAAELWQTQLAAELSRSATMAPAGSAWAGSGRFVPKATWSAPIVSTRYRRFAS